MGAVQEVFGLEELVCVILDHLSGRERPFVLWSLFKCNILKESGISHYIDRTYTHRTISWYRNELEEYPLATLKNLARTLGFRGYLKHLMKPELLRVLEPFKEYLRVVPAELVKYVVPDLNAPNLKKLANAKIVFDMTGQKVEVPDGHVYPSSIHEVLPALVQDIHRTCTKSTVKEVFLLPERVVETMCRYYLKTVWGPPLVDYSLKESLSKAIEYHGGSWEGILQAHANKAEREERKRKREDEKEKLESWLISRGYYEILNEEKRFFSVLNCMVHNATGYTRQASAVATSRVFLNSGHEAPAEESIQEAKKLAESRKKRWLGRMKKIAAECSALGYAYNDLEGDNIPDMSVRLNHVATWGYILTNKVSLQTAMEYRKVMEENNLPGESAAYRFLKLDEIFKKALENDMWQDMYPSLKRHLYDGNWFNEAIIRNCIVFKRTEAEQRQIDLEERERERQRLEERLEKAIRDFEANPSLYISEPNNHGVPIYSCSKCSYHSGLRKMVEHARKTCFAVPHLREDNNA